MHVLQDHLLEVGWNNSLGTQRDVEKSINCCGFRQVDYNGTCDAVSVNPCSVATRFPARCFISTMCCVSLLLLQVCFPNHSCLPCANKIQEHAGKVLHFVGGIGLFFSFTEVSHSCNTVNRIIAQ